MKNMKNMKNNNIMEKLYVGMDIHEKYITGTAMKKDVADKDLPKPPRRKQLLLKKLL